MRAEERLTEIEARAAAATEGPWSPHDFGHQGEEEPSSIVVHTGRFDWQAIYDGEDSPAVAWMPGWDSQEDSNARFITAARQDVPALTAALRAVLELHSPAAVASGQGAQCYEDYPCTTVQAITAALEGAE